jgi:hypothetical protein
MVRGTLSTPVHPSVDFHYRCEACRHVWTTTKGAGDVLPHVAEPKPTPIKAELPPKPHKSRIA